MKIQILILAMVLAIPLPALAASGSAGFIISQINTQWSSDIVHITPVQPHTIVNPNGCTYGNAYGLDATLGQKERVSIALAALLNNKTVAVVVEGCTSDGRPKAISIYINR